MPEHEYFSERTLGPALLDQPNIGIKFWKGFVVLIWRFDDAANFAEDFPALCNDSPIPYGTASRTLGLAFSAEVPAIGWPFDPERLPTDQLAIFDAVEFFFQHVSKPTSFSYHAFFKHNHIDTFDRQVGRDDYRSKVNQLLRRNRHPYQLQEVGKIEKMGPPVLDSVLRNIRFHTGDAVLDGILETARAKFHETDPALRKESLEKLWDAWERIRSIRDPGNIQESIRRILEEVAPEPNFRERLNTEATELNSIGNNFMIRHARSSVTPITSEEQVDYLFHRLFSLIWLILKKLNLAS